MTIDRLADGASAGEMVAVVSLPAGMLPAGVLP